MKGMRFGKRLKFGDVVLTEVPFVDLQEKKKRPALVLFEEHGNLVVAAITSNLSMEGILLKKSNGLIVDSIIKLNYIFTLPVKEVVKILTKLSKEKKKEVCSKLNKMVGCDSLS